MATAERRVAELESLVTEPIHEAGFEDGGLRVFLALCRQRLGDASRSARLVHQDQHADRGPGLGPRPFGSGDGGALAKAEKSRLVPRDDVAGQIRMRREHLGAVATDLELDELVLRIPRGRIEPGHQLDGAAVIVGRRQKQRQRGGRLEKASPVLVRVAREQHQGLHLRMAASELDRLVHAAARAARAEDVPAHARLRLQVPERDVDVAKP